MNQPWEVIYSTSLPHRAELVKALLTEHDIPALVVNRQSSSYPTINGGKDNIDVRVPADQAIPAKVIVEHEATFR